MATATLATCAIISTLGRRNFYLIKALAPKDRAFIGGSASSSSPASAPLNLGFSDCNPSPISPLTFFPASPMASPFGFQRSDLMEAGSYAEELSVAVRVVQMACSLCQGVQEGLFGRRREQIKSKDDASLVTVAGLVHACVFFFFFLPGVRIPLRKWSFALKFEAAGGLDSRYVSCTWKLEECWCFRLVMLFIFLKNWLVEYLLRSFGCVLGA